MVVSGRLVGLLGHPVGHSLSPAMHNAAFASAGLDFTYRAWDVPPPALPAALADLWAAGVVGLNVTIPHKAAVLEHVASADELARLAGSANTLSRTATGWAATSTDGAGLLLALAARGHRLCGPAAVAGAGGAAAAVVAALATAGFAPVVVANRTLARAQRLAARLDPAGRQVRPAPLDEGGAWCAGAGLVVNATPLGTGGLATAWPVAPRHLAAGAVACDLAYGPQPTRWLTAAAQAGHPTVDGRLVLVHQGALAWPIWTGRQAPLEAMLAAVGLTREPVQQESQNPVADGIL